MLILFMLCILENIEARIHKLPKWSELPGIDVSLQEMRHESSLIGEVRNGKG